MEKNVGDYTGVRFNAVLSEKGKEIVQGLLRAKTWNNDCTPHLFEEWRRQWRSEFIPFGAVLYMPKDWKYTNMCVSFEHMKYTWVVCCSVKDDGIVSQFLRNVLPYLISEPCVVETYFELDAKPVIHDIKPREKEDWWQDNHIPSK
jgi:hypothetical protein